MVNHLACASGRSGLAQRRDTPNRSVCPCTCSRRSYRLRAKRKSGLIKPPAGDGPPVGSASLRSVSGETNLQPRS